MRAAFYDRQGEAADVLHVGDLPDPSPGPGEVKIRVVMSGVNPSDVKTRTGFVGPMAFARVIPHQDGAGVIAAVGAGVDPARVGERVWVYEAQTGRPCGTAAEYVTLPSQRAPRLPDGVSFEIGASLGVPALTAHRCLFADGDVRGSRVLIHGGAGVVGEAAILLAKWAGAWIATTVRSAADEATARRAGADLVINRRDQDVAAVLRAAPEARSGVDRIVDVDVIANLHLDLACLAPGGTVSAYSAHAPDAALSLPVLKAMASNVAFRFVYVYTMAEDAKQAAVAAVTACLQAAAYRPTVGMTLALDQIVQAHEAQGARSTKGKILLKTTSALV